MGVFSVGTLFGMVLKADTSDTDHQVHSNWWFGYVASFGTWVGNPIVGLQTPKVNPHQHQPRILRTPNHQPPRVTWTTPRSPSLVPFYRFFFLGRAPLLKQTKPKKVGSLIVTSLQSLDNSKPRVTCPNSFHAKWVTHETGTAAQICRASAPASSKISAGFRVSRQPFRQQGGICCGTSGCSKEYPQTRVPRVSMSLNHWGHHPKYRGHVPIFKGSSTYF